MTDLRARLAEALRQHGVGDECLVDWDRPDRLADVLLSLPGIAIVELPERNDKGGWPCGCDGRTVWLDASSLTIRTLGGTLVHNPRAFAAALLAAARAAEG